MNRRYIVFFVLSIVISKCTAGLIGDLIGGAHRVAGAVAGGISQSLNFNIGGAINKPTRGPSYVHQQGSDRPEDTVIIIQEPNNGHPGYRPNEPYGFQPNPNEPGHHHQQHHHHNNPQDNNNYNQYNNNQGGYSNNGLPQNNGVPNYNYEQQNQNGYNQNQNGYRPNNQYEHGPNNQNGYRPEPNSNVNNNNNFDQNNNQNSNYDQNQGGHANSGQNDFSYNRPSNTDNYGPNNNNNFNNKPEQAKPVQEINNNQNPTNTLPDNVNEFDLNNIFTSSTESNTSPYTVTTTKKPKDDRPLFVPLRPNEYVYQGDKIDVSGPKRETNNKITNTDVYGDLDIDIRMVQ